MRSEFEKLPQIKDVLLSIKFNDDSGSYETNDFSLYGACIFINGAWCTYQEQQRKYNDLKIMYDKAIECLMESNYDDKRYLKNRGVIK